ncbi:hypothetical protein ACFY7C_00770 [Streptomyces sp. NPDC012769]|uniref:hypothetical protein n=1 Tax=Streptomyces sp. NPDC012769 TaxID=3364848 RepID=UPI0036BBFB12
MTEIHGVSLAALRDQGALPSSHHCVYLSGSLVRGWGNALSDVDVYVITDEDWSSPTAELGHVALEPDTLPVEIRYVDGRRWDIEYWRETQIDQVLAKVDWSVLDGSKAAGNRLSSDELYFLERLSYAAAVSGDDWLRERKEQLDKSAMRSVLVARSLNNADTYTQDVIGQLEAGDVESAVLSTKIAFGHAVDALVAAAGEYGLNPKWRARRFRAAAPGLLTFEEYWSVENMHRYDPSDPRAWVEEALEICQRISLEVSV